MTLVSRAVLIASLCAVAAGCGRDSTPAGAAKPAASKPDPAVPAGKTYTRTEFEKLALYKTPPQVIAAVTA